MSLLLRGIASAALFALAPRSSSASAPADLPPVLTLRGPVKLVLPASSAGEPYRDVGAEAWDDKEGNITERVVVDSDVDLSRPGR